MPKDTKNQSNAGFVIRNAELSIPHSTIRTPHFSLGQVDFINCLPINLPIESRKVNIDAKLINGVPSELNKMILSNEIDIAPVSSVAYLENKDKLVPIADLCIASNGSADSVLLFSCFPIEELDGSKIALSYASATSNKLLEIIMKEFIKVEVKYELKNNTLSELLKTFPAALFIGDLALIEFSKKPTNMFVYDLGLLWKKYTGLPMTFGMWVARKNLAETRPKEIEIISKELNAAKNIGLKDMFGEVIKKAQNKILLPKEFYETYFKHLSYDFNNECKKGLDLFEKHCKKLELTLTS